MRPIHKFRCFEQGLIKRSSGKHVRTGNDKQDLTGWEIDNATPYWTSLKNWYASKCFLLVDICIIVRSFEFKLSLDFMTDDYTIKKHSDIFILFRLRGFKIFSEFQISSIEDNIPIKMLNPYHRLKRPFIYSFLLLKICIKSVKHQKTSTPVW